jgi:hypothetical protein
MHKCKGDNVKKFSADTAVVASPDKVRDDTVVRSFIQNWLAPALVKKLTEKKLSQS